MLKITILNRTTKTAGQIRLRFRVRDGRKCDITYKSDIVADLRDLAKLDASGEPRPHISKINPDLCNEIRAARDTLQKAYKAAAAAAVTITGEDLQREYKKIVNPDRARVFTMQTRFEKYYFDCGRAGILGVDRQRAYKVLGRILYRFLTIYKMQDIAPADFGAQQILDFRDFLENEYNFVPEYRQLYLDCKEGDTPQQPRSANTTAKYLKMLQAFFAELESLEEIAKSPFRKITKDKKQKIMRERYAAPVYLYAEELQQILKASVPEPLQAVKDAFLLQCALGCRVGDFAKLTAANIATAPDGFYYIHYLPEKTAGESKDFAEVQTPLIWYAAEIIARCGFRFPILRNITGQAGYNAKIKELLKICGICRECLQRDEKAGANIYVPLYELGSSKLARKSFVDMLTKVQVNMYAAGLHKKGSAAVKHYTDLELKDRFALMCSAFEQPVYKAGEDIIL